MYAPGWWIVHVLIELLFSCLFRFFFATWEIKSKMTLSWVYLQIATLKSTYYSLLTDKHNDEQWNFLGQFEQEER